MKLLTPALVFLLLMSSARAEDIGNDQTAYIFPNIPDEATKVWALKRAYQLNGNSMVGNNRMIDLSQEKPFTNPVKTEKITATIPVVATAAPIAAVPVPIAPVSDTCTKHRMHKVITGKSWRCRK